MIIPDYQRNYCWEKAQCEELFDDLVSTMETRQNHYLGNIIDDEQFLTYTMDEKLDRKEFENQTFCSFSILNTKFETHDYQVLLLDILTYLEDDHAQQLYDLVNQNIENGVPLLITDKENNIPWPDHNIYLLLPKRSKNYTYNFINRLKPILEACNVNLSDIEFSLV